MAQRPREEEVELLRMEDRGSRTESTPAAAGGSRRRRDSTVGILRLDLARPRHASAGSASQGCGEPVSPQPSVLSVTFAADETNMDKVRFEPDSVPSEGEEEEGDEDYSASVSAIIQRKASCRRSRRGRRSSSPATDVTSADPRTRRRSSVFTTSSGDTAISMAEDTVEEQIMQNIKVHKEVLSSVKQQPWNMRRKLRLVRQAKAYIRRHEGELQERLAQNRSTRDVLARFNIVIIKYWQQTKRELANTMNVLIPWEIRIKEIESHFGSVVASYFTFLRWLFWVNLVTAVVLIVFVAVPEMLMANTKKAGMRKKMMDDEKANSTNLFTLWDFEGVLKYSPMFYGYYSHQDPEDKSLAKSIGYTMPLAYFLTELIVYIYSFVAILRRMAENSRQSKLSEKDDECIFTWKLFTGWDYMIGNSETAHNRTASIILGFKEALLEEAEKKRDEGRNWKVTGLRVFAHLNVVWLLASSVYAVILVVDRSTQPGAEHGWWRRNEITIVVSLITSLFPMFFEGLGYIEQYHPRKKLRMQLGRIMVLNLMNLYTLIFASFSKINEMSTILQGLRPKNGSMLMYERFPTAAPQIAPIIQNVGTIPISSLGDQTSHSIFNSYQTIEECKNITVPCSTTQTIGLVSITLSVLANFTLPTSNSTVLSSSLPSSPYPTSDSSFQTFKEATQLINFPETTESVFGVNKSLENSTISDEDSLQINMFLDLSKNAQNIPEDMFEYININNGTTEDFNGSYIKAFFTEARETQNITAEYTDIISTTQSSYFDGTHSSKNSDETSDSGLLHSSGTDVVNDESSTTGYSLPQTSSISSPSEELCVELVCETIPITTFSPTTDFVDIVQTTTTSNSEPGAQDREVQYTDLTAYIDTLDEDTHKRLRPLCWETMFGREMVKLTVMDLIMTVSGILMVDFFRAVFVRAMNNCWCWDLEKEFPKYGDFKIAENILHLVNNQGMVWMGMFFSPGLPLINIIKLAIMMYLRSWAVLTCNVPHEVVFRASRSNNFYLALLLTMLFLCVLPVGYAVVWVVPSWHCGPFSNYHRIYHIFTRSLKKALPYKKVHLAFDYMASPGIVIPLLMLLVLIIYYLISLTNALREANNDLKIQLRHERTEERRKMFQLVNKKQKEVQDVEHSVKKWKKIIPNSYHKPSIADIPIDVLKSKVLSSTNGSAKYSSKHRDIVDEIVKKTKRMPSGTSEEDNNFLIDAEDVTDIEQHESLPYEGFNGSKPLDLSPEIINKPKKLLQKAYKESKASKNSGHGKNKIYNEDKDESITSGWSDIPEIRIIETGSTDKINDSIKLSNVSPNLEKKQKYPSAQKKVSKLNGKTGVETQLKNDEEQDGKKVKDRKIVKISTTKTTDKMALIKKNSSIRKDLSDLPGYYKGTAEHSDIENAGLDTHEKESTDYIKIKRSALKNNHAPKPDPLDTKSTNKSKSGQIKKLVFKPKQIGNQESNKSNLSNSNKAVKNSSSTLLTHTTSQIKDEHESMIEAENTKNNSSDSEEDKVITTIADNVKCSKSDEDDELSIHIESDDEEGSCEQSGTENDEGSNSDKRDEFVLRKQVKKPKTSLKEREGSGSDDSDLSSLSTVKQIDINVKKNNNGETKDTINEEGIHRKESSKRSTEYPGDNKKRVARFKIAKVLLNEARRRSSAGLDDK